MKRFLEILTKSLKVVERFVSISILILLIVNLCFLLDLKSEINDLKSEIDNAKSDINYQTQSEASDTRSLIREAYNELSSDIYNAESSIESTVRRWSY